MSNNLKLMTRTCGASGPCAGLAALIASGHAVLHAAFGCPAIVILGSASSEDTYMANYCAFCGKRFAEYIQNYPSVVPTEAEMPARSAMH